MRNTERESIMSSKIFKRPFQSKNHITKKSKQLGSFLGSRRPSRCDSVPELRSKAPASTPSAPDHFAYRIYGYITMQISKRNIMDYTYVSQRTADRWYYGDAIPKQIYREMIEYKAMERILPPGWRWSRDQLISPNGHTFNWGDLENYRTVLSSWRQMLDDYQRLSDLVEVLMVRADKHQRRRLQRVHGVINRHIQAANEEPVRLPAKQFHRKEGC